MSSLEKLGEALGQIPTGTSPFTAHQEETLRRAQSADELRAALAADDTLQPALRAAFEIEAFRTALADDHDKLVALVRETANPPDARRFAPSATVFTGAPNEAEPVDFPYEAVKAPKANGHVVIYVRGYRDSRPLNKHILATELQKRGYAVYSYGVREIEDWAHYDYGAGYAESLNSFVEMVW